jgi:hypothetical protein
LYMLEATDGHVVTNDLPSNLILAEFPIVEETADSIVFDFNSGMSKIFTIKDWRAQDMSGSGYNKSVTAVPVHSSFIESAKMSPGNRLVIRQIAQVESSSDSGPEFPSFEVRYFLSPYRPDPTYKSVVSRDVKLAGFFEVAPRLNLVSGTTTVRATRHHPAKPIVFAISANTPAEYKQAMRDGILYWNRYLSNEAIRVIDAPAGVTAPDMDYNVIQWVPYDTGAFAYADAMMDPRTGEILHAQAFIPSAFAFSGRKKARTLLQQAQASEENHTEVRLGWFGLKGFETHEHDHANHISCALPVNKAFSQSLAGILASGVSDNKIMKASQDYVRSTVAHEVGHLLGLRHNFAGSLSTQNYPLKERAGIFQQYLSSGEVRQDLVVSSSIMDYLPFEEDALVGQAMAKGTIRLDYDAKAISILYDGKAYKAEEIAPFCTDSQTSSFVDCQKFDEGSLIEFAASSTQKRLDELPYEIVEKYVAKKAPREGEVSVRVEAVALNPETVAQNLLEVRKTLVGAFENNSHFLAIYRNFPVVDSLNEDTVKQEEVRYVSEQVEKAGGLANVFSLVPSDYYAKILRKIEELLKKDYRTGRGLSDQWYEFSSEEVSKIMDRVNLLVKKLPPALTKGDLEILGKLPSSWKNLDNSLGVELARLLKQRMEEYLFKIRNEPIITQVEYLTGEPKEKGSDASASAKTWDAGATHSAVRTSEVELPKFFYPVETRTSAAALLEPGTEEGGLDWGFQERAEIRTGLVRLLNHACNCDIETLKIENVRVSDKATPETRRAVTLWFMESKKVLNNIKTN